MSDEGHHLARGLLWLGSATAVARIVDALALVLVLRFLSREEIGLATLAWSVAVFVECFNGLGIGTALLQAPDLTRTQTSSAFWYATTIAGVLASGVLLSAPLIAGAYDMPALTPLIRASASKLVFVGLAAVPLALLAKNLRYRALGAVTTSATLTSSVVTLGLAAAGFGAWAPLLGNVCNGLAQMLGAWVLCERFATHTFDWKALRPVARTGVHVAGSVAVVQLSRNLDYLLLGRVVSTQALGGYRVAFDLAMAPSIAILQVGNRSALPVYAKLGRALDKLNDAWLWTVRTVTLMTVPALVLVFVDGEIILALLGKSGWPDAALTIRLLCVAAFMRGIAETLPSVYVAAGKSQLSLVHALVNLALVAVAMLAGLRYLQHDRVLVVAGAWVVATLGLVLVSLSISKRAVSLSPLSMIKRLTDPALVFAACAVPALALEPWLPQAPALALLSHGVLILGGYAIALRSVVGVRMRTLLGGGHRQIHK